MPKATSAALTGTTKARPKTPAAVSEVELGSERKSRADKTILRWQETSLLPMKIASAAAGVSITSLYRFADVGKLKLRTLAGRTLVDTKSLIALIEDAADWSPTNRGAEARAKRCEIARASHSA